MKLDSIELLAPGECDSDTASPDIPPETWHPLSANQLSLWFEYHLHSASQSAHNIAFSVRVHGGLDAPMVRRALIALIARHPILAAVFSESHGQPRQRIQFGAIPEVREVNARGWSDERLAQSVREDVARPFDLAAGPLARASLFAVAADESVLLIAFDHIVCDGWSYWLLLEELGALLAEDDGDVLAAEPIDARVAYFDYVAWQRSPQACAQVEQQWQYWRRQLDNLPAVDLPLDKPRGRTTNCRGGTMSFTLDATLSAKLTKLVSDTTGTLYATLLAAFEILLHRYSGQDEVVVGSPMPGRNLRHWGKVAGHFVNPVVLRADASGNPSVRAFLRCARDTALLAMKNQDLPFPVLVERLQIARDPTRHPLFQVMFVLQNARHGRDLLSLWQNETDAQTVSWGGLELTPFPLLHQECLHDLTLEALDLGERLFVAFNFNADLFESATIERMAGHFRALLAGMIEHPDTGIDDLPLLNAAERRQVLVEFNDTAAEFPRDKCIHELFEAQVAAAPDATALVSDEQSLTCADLNQRANQLAHRLRGMGVGPDTLVAICMERSMEMVVGLLAILKAGGAYVPIDPSYPAERIGFMLEDAAPKVVLTQKRFRSTFSSPGSVIVCLDSDWPETTQYSCHNLPVTDTGLTPRHLAYVIFTSGSTGRPKGVMIEHRSLTNHVFATIRNYELTSSDRVLQFAAPAFDVAGEELWPSLTCGSCVVLRGSDIGDDPVKFTAWVDRQRLTVLNLPASFWGLWGTSFNGEEGLLSGVRLVVVGSEAVRIEAAVAWQRRFGTRIELINAYGPTEATITASLLVVPANPGHAYGDLPFLPIGRPIANVRMYVLDAKGRPVPIGVPGELHIAGIGLARKYLNRPELTAERFVSDPFIAEPGERMYRTSDLARWLPDGNIEFLGRNDSQVKIRGFRIELGEIESQLLTHPAIREVVVVAREDAAGGKRLVAYVVAHGGAEPPTVEDMRAHLRARLPDYMVPSAFVTLESLPLTPNGKLDSRALPAPDVTALAQATYEVPWGETETSLAAMWREVLDVERIGRHDDFFALGGHSLLAMQVVSRIHRVLGVEVGVRQIFETPTLTGMAQALAGKKTGALSPIAPADRTGPLPLSFAQERLWFLDRLEGAGAAYHMPGVLRLNGRLDPTALTKALDTIVARHESLRTHFVEVNGEATQVIASADDARFALQTVDLSDHSSTERETEVQRQAEEEAAAAFGLTTGPLIRGRLLKLAEDEHALLVTMHHIVSDGWSIGVLISELTALYEAFTQGRPDPLPTLAIQYADYAVWQRTQLSGKRLQEQLTCWKNALAGAPALLELPSDRPRPAEERFIGASVPVTLDTTLAARLRTLSKNQDATLFMTLLTGWAALLSRLSGQSEIVVGTPVASRQRAELEGLIGFFVNTLALRVDLTGEVSATQALGRVKAMALEAFSCQDVPFEQVVEAVQQPRSLSHSPVFQVMFVWQNTPRVEMRLPDLTVVVQETTQHVARCDMTLSLEENADGAIAGTIEYASDLFDHATVERWAGHFVTLLEGLVAQPEEHLDRIPLLTNAEREQVLIGFNDTSAEFPHELCVHEMFERQVAVTPDAIALMFEDKRLTYAELNARANQLAHYLRSMGVGPDILVGICVERSIEMVVGLLGILKAGGAYVPIDSDYPSERIAHMVNDAVPRVLLTQKHLSDRLPTSSAQIVCLDVDDDALKLLPATAPSSDVTATNLAYVIYTSGSTGRPKGAMNEHNAVVNRLHWMQREYGLNDSDRVLQKTPFSFDVSVWEFFWPLMSGATLVMAHPGGHRDNAYLTEVIERERITTLHFVPSMLQVFVEAPALRRCASLKRVICSGEALPYALTQRFFSKFPGVELHNLYGPTECAVDVTTWACYPNDPSGIVPIGHPISNTRMYVLDAHKEPCPIGVMGELFIGGVQVGRGYLNRPELTAECFLPDSFVPEPGARIYKTGDLARWRRDGEIEYLGRNDFQVKVRGFRIELGEIESQLLAHPAIREAAVLAREDAVGDKRLVAYVVASVAGETPAVEDMRTHLRTRVPEYMVPSAFVVLDVLPLTPNGKLDRKALPAPDRNALATTVYEPPEGETETVLAEIWREVLGVERVGRHDDFFALGGHSLLVPRVLDRFRRAGWDIQTRDVFVAPTLAGLAVLARPAGDGFVSPPNLIPDGCEVIRPEMLSLASMTQDEIDNVVANVTGGAANVKDIYPLMPLQEGILYHHLASVQGDPYIQSMTLRCESRKRLDEVLEALQSVIDRHDLLRSSVHWEGVNTPVQVVWRKAILPVREIQLSSEGDAVEQLLAQVDPRQTRMDLRRAPLMSAYAAADPHSTGWLVLLLSHHLNSDHVGLEIVIEEIQSCLHGRARELPAPVPFRGFVAQTLAKARSGEDEAFFRDLLGDVDEPTTPFGLLDAQLDGQDMQEATCELAPDLARRLRLMARNMGVSPAALFHVAWALVVGRCSGRDDVVFGSVMSGRSQGAADVERVMGLFINTLPVRLSLTKEGVRETVLRMHRLLADLLRHEQASLALAQRCSNVRPPMPLFTAILNYRHSSASTILNASGIQVLRAEDRVNYPFGLSVDDLGQDFTLMAQTQSADGIDSGRLIGFMNTTLAALVEALETAPQTPLSALDVLTVAEREQVLIGFNDTAVDFPRDLCVHELFEAQVAATPDATALVFEDRSLTYAELNARANRLAHYLRDLGVGPDTLVAICVERGIEMVVAMLGILKSGGAYVPIDPSYPTERIAFMLADSAPKVVLTQEQLAPALPPTGAHCLCLDTGVEIVRRQPAENLLPGAIGLTPAHLAYAVYTSGSTGKPKGMMVEHRSLCNLIHALIAAFDVQRDSRVLQFVSLSFDVATLDVFLTMSAGATLCLASKKAPDLLGQLSRERITHMQLPVAALAALQYSDLPLLQVIVSGGDVCPGELVNRWARRRRFFNAYGPTETTVCVTMAECRCGGGRPPIGRPIANTRAYILDSRQQPTPIGVIGELHIAGVQVGRGYLNRPELTAERFPPDPFAPNLGARMYKTGDMARWLPDGNIEYLGRNDSQVKIRGFRIELGEIGSMLLTHAAIREAVVTVREDDAGGKRLVAHMVLRTEVEPPSIEGLRAHLQERLPGYMVPSAFVTLDAMPLTPNGKLDRKALPAPDQSALAAAAYEAPQGESEIVLAAIWREVLGVERVGRHDDFFALGGHSLLAVQVVSRVAQALGVEIGVLQIFATPTLTGMAQFVADVRKMRTAISNILDRRTELDPDSERIEV